jgi:hypothetical protein
MNLLFLVVMLLNASVAESSQSTSAESTESPSPTTVIVEADQDVIP